MIIILRFTDPSNSASNIPLASVPGKVRADSVKTPRGLSAPADINLLYMRHPAHSCRGCVLTNKLTPDEIHSFLSNIHNLLLLLDELGQAYTRRIDVLDIINLVLSVFPEALL